MGQVAFDTLKFVETLETAGLPKDQAKAISLAVRESHEAVDVATKRDLEDVRKELSAEVTAVKHDLEDVRKDLSAEIADVRKDLSIQIADVRKDMDARFDKVDARFEKTYAQIADVRKDMAAGFDKINDKFEKLGMQMTIRLGLMVAAAVSIIAAILKM